MAFKMKLQLLALAVVYTLNLEIKQNKYFALIVNEMTDISTKEQVSISLRHVKDDFTVLKISLSCTKHLQLQERVVLPAMLATAERFFSTLWCLKTWLHSTMIQECLNHMSILTIHQDLAKDFSNLYIAKKLISSNDTKSLVFGHI